MPKYQTQLFNAALRDHRESITFTKRKLRELKANRRKLNAIGSAIGAALNGDTTDVNVTYPSANSVHVTMDQLESLKCQRLEMVLNGIINLPDAVVGHTSDWPGSLNRDYHFTVADIRVTVAAYVRSDSPTCRKVLVKTETIQSPVYEIRCD
jgi:hypothetical protein